MQIKEFSGEQGRIFFRQSGSGKTVVLLHGFGESGTIWEDTAKAFSGQYHFIIPDLPGSGYSPAFADKASGMEAYAGLIHEMISSISNEQIILLGHSMGGYITLALAEKYPECLKGWGLIHSTAFADSEEKKANRKKAITFLLSNGSEAFLKTAIPGLFHDVNTHEKEIQYLMEEAANIDPLVLCGYYEAMMNRPDRRKVLTESQVPVCIISGRHDQAVPFSQSLEQSHLSPCCHFSILRNTSHMGMLEEPLAFRHHFGSFLASLGQ
jgi:pimeloyl-ACP methyl ester carboxylesterase